MNRLMHDGRATRWLALNTNRRLIPLQGDRGVVSFSFDDVPKSACTAGAEIMDTHGVRATWYVAGALTNRIEAGNLCHSADDLRKLQQHGHHIACHTFSHLPCAGRTVAELKKDIELNRLYLADLGLPTDNLHFSYPLGSFDRRSKAFAGQQYASCRITGGGLQTGYVDLNALRSERLYQSTQSEHTIRELVKKTASKKGWLIFYTHDVQDNPSAWGCTASLLDVAVKSAKDVDCAVLSVDRALTYWKSSIELR